MAGQRGVGLGDAGQLRVDGAVRGQVRRPLQQVDDLDGELPARRRPPGLGAPGEVAGEDGDHGRGEEERRPEDQGGRLEDEEDDRHRGHAGQERGAPRAG